MRVALEIVAVLEGAGLALVRVDREVARLRALPDELPLASGRKARAAQAAQPRGVERSDQIGHRLALLIAGRLEPEAVPEQAIAAAIDVALEAARIRDVGVGVTGLDRQGHLVRGRVVDVVVADLGDGCPVAVPHAGRAHHPDPLRIEASA